MQPHITVAHKKSARAREANDIAEWTRLEEPIVLTGTVEYFTKLQVKRRGKVTLMEIPSEFVGKIIGKKGATIQLLQQQSGARIDLEDDDTPRGTRMVWLSGSSISRQRCAEEIQKIVWKAVVLSSE